MTVPLSNTKLRVPNGFPGLLEAFTREVLRSQPENIFAFGATYFEKLMSPKEKVVEKPAEVESESKDRFYNNDSFKTDDFDPSNPQQQESALKIQTKYRQHAAKKEVQHIREDQAAVKIQAGVRGFIDRQKLKLEQGGENTDQQEDDKGKETIEKEEKQTSDSKEMADPKATSEPTEAKAEENIDIDLNDPDVQNAAVKIQAGFKGLKARRQMDSSKKTDDPKVGDQPNMEEENKPEITASEIKEQDQTSPEEPKAATEQTEEVSKETTEQTPETPKETTEQTEEVAKETIEQTEEVAKETIEQTGEVSKETTEQTPEASKETTEQTEEPQANAEDAAPEESSSATAEHSQEKTEETEPKDSQETVATESESSTVAAENPQEKTETIEPTESQETAASEQQEIAGQSEATEAPVEETTASENSAAPNT